MEAQGQVIRRSSNGKGKAHRKNGAAHGLKVDCKLSTKGVDPFDQLEWDRRSCVIKDDKGNVIFEQANVEVPKSWSMLATNVVASKYFYGPAGAPARENSVRQLVHRVARTIADSGRDMGYFAAAEDVENFYRELVYICINQYGSFNSPVWFNVGLHHVYGYSSTSRVSYGWDEKAQAVGKCPDAYKQPQASACFIQSVKDTMEDIMRLVGAEALLFKYGSGTGTDMSTLRSSRERLSGGGTPSGPLSFMRVFDQVAAVVKSGGKTRRAAKMQSLKVHHPDIMDFIECKAREERKAWALIDQGYDGSFGGEAYESIMYQNANLSVRVSDEFMQAVEKDGMWQTRAVTTGEPMDTYRARDIMQKIAACTHQCGDPGLQYDTTINKWHTCLNSGRINASNPCSEFMFLDNSACNLASLNLMRFVDEDGKFETSRFAHAVRMFTVAQDILVDMASYPTQEIAENSHRFRPLGLGYANLGAVLMRSGMPYDSDDGRMFSGTVTALMTGYSYLASEELAEAKGTFDGYTENRDCMLDVIRLHRNELQRLDPHICPADLLSETLEVWDRVFTRASRVGFRNSQVTLLAPTGTIGFMMDCDTTGVEPDLALVKYKQLAGGGTIKIINGTIKPALDRLGYSREEVIAILQYIEDSEMIEGAPLLKPEHLEVFDCAFKPKNGRRYISYKAHLRMMAAVQPFLSGAISKTVNLPSEVTEEEIMQTYMDGWRMGLKAVAVYRDGSKRTQPLNTSRAAGSVPAKGAAVTAPAVSSSPFRRRMPMTRQSLTHKFTVADHEGYLTVGIYEDGSPGELFITMAKEGSTVGGTMDSFGTAISMCLQYGVPLQVLAKKFAHSRFEPSGFTNNPEIPIAKSIVDYIFRWLDLTFPNGKVRGLHLAQPDASGCGGGTSAARDMTPEVVATTASATVTDASGKRFDEQFGHFMDDAPACNVCGAITVRNGACFKCFTCGNSMGCS
jgi:ribonucleoside-diphosphate reductase alpha chain